MFVNTCSKSQPRRSTVNWSVGCVGWFTTWFNDLRGKKWNGTLA